MARKRRKGQRAEIRKDHTAPSSIAASSDASADAIKAAEDVALAAFASGLKIAAAFGTVAAKTTSLALESLATGADKFSELVKREALASARGKAKHTSKKRNRVNRQPKERLS
jgi:hypothetical protein